MTKKTEMLNLNEVLRMFGDYPDRSRSTFTLALYLAWSRQVGQACFVSPQVVYNP